VQAQVAEGTDEPPKVALDLGSSSATPGAVSAVALTLTTATEIRDALLTITFPKGILRFVRDERGAVARRAGAKLASTERATEGETSSILEVRISAPKGIAQGILAYLHFRTDETARVGDQVTLENEPVEVTLADGSKQTRLGGTDGHIVIISADLPPLFSCFFYMH
jgi:hypothetical protein